MIVKRVIVLLVVACMVLATPTSAGMKTHWMKTSGTYYLSSVYSGNGTKKMIKWSDLSKKEKKEALKLYKNNPRKLYKKYGDDISLGRIFKLKIKSNTITIWGKFNRVSNGVKKKYKFGKYKFKLARNAALYYQSEVESYTYRGAKLKKHFKNNMGGMYKCYVSGGKIYKIVAVS